MRTFAKPLVIVSRCLGFANCRYNGQVLSDKFIDSLRPLVNFITPCPEVEIGLGIPRSPVRIAMLDGKERLVQPLTENDVTELMEKYSANYLKSEELNEVDGCILKSLSPSCGIKDVKVYKGLVKSPVIQKSSGLFGRAVINRFPGLPVEDEGRLSNFSIREHFLTRLFTIANYRQIRKNMKMRDLVKFQSDNKLLLMAYNQTEMRKMGRLVANFKKKDIKTLAEEYECHLKKALARKPKYTSNINVLMHALGYFSENLTAKEKAFFLDSLENYREGKVPLSVPVHLVKTFIIRFDEEYLMEQTYFEPYPELLVEITDSGKGRKL